MPPSTFASAAAGVNRDSQNRQDASSVPGNEWVNRRTNGFTQTFRRTSSNVVNSQFNTQNPPSTINATPVATQSIREQNNPNASSNGRPAAADAGPGVYVPPHRMANGLGGPLANPVTDLRYSKGQLLTLFRGLQDESELDNGLEECYVSGWEPGSSASTNGTSASSPWSRREDAKEIQYNLDVAWDHSGSSIPLGLTDMTEDEEEFFANVNSTVKPPALNTGSKDPTNHRNERKVSSNQAQGGSSGTFGLSSPNTTRPSNRRRETSEGSYPFPTTTSRDTRTPTTESSPFSGLKRSVTSGAGTWSSSNSGFAPMGSFGAGSRPGLSTMRSESRFKGLMSREGESSDQNAREGNAIAQLDSHPEETSTAKLPGSMLEEQESSEDDESEDDDDDANEMLGAAGSAALAGSLDVSPPRTFQRDAFGTPARLDSGSGFAALRAGSSNADIMSRGFPGLSGFATQSSWGQSQTPQHARHAQESSLGGSMSPTDTNPYQSPGNDQTEVDDADRQRRYVSALPSATTQDQGVLPGLGGLGNTAVGSASSRNLPPLAGLGGLGGLPGLGATPTSPWSSGALGGPGVIGTPTRERPAFGFGGASAFGDPPFSQGSEPSLPALAGLGSSSMFGSMMAAAGLSGLGRTGGLSKMNSFLPKDMREDLRAPGSGRSNEGDLHDLGLSQPGAAGRDSPYRPGRGLFDDKSAATVDEFAAQASAPQSMKGYRASPTHQSSPASGRDSTVGQFIGSAPGAASAGPNVPMPQADLSQPPLAQVRRMVMPDRIRWIYKDPQGQVQGPFTGLEMNDWYKAGFFTPELLIRKVEDEDYEPLAQLIRRIGNSREPFLVPLLGIPQGESPVDTPSVSSPWPSSTGLSSSTAAAVVGQSRGVVPPFAGSFPSFGTTLTAEQQNALERRKQEEQYLMALQKEHLAQHQMWQKQMQGGHRPPHSHILPFGAPQQPGLHHYGSTHSLHSQPSFGSIHAPYQPGAGGLPSGPTSNVPNTPQSMPFHEQNQSRLNQVPGSSIEANTGLANIREEELPGYIERLAMSQNASHALGPQIQAGAIGVPGQGPHQNDGVAVVQMLAERERLLQEQQERDSQMTEAEALNTIGSEQRLKQFNRLRAGNEQSETITQLGGRPTQIRTETLTEQVQKAQSAKQQRLDTSTISAFQQSISPPSESRASPIPAPVAQRRTMQTVAESLAADSRSQTQSPAVSAQSPAADTPSVSLAPWAAQNAETSKGPSLREIQEMEAKKAKARELAEQEKRRIAMEREILALQQQAAAASKEPAPGLPSSANWAAAPSPSEAKASPSVWTAATASKTVASPSTATKKTLQQIQKEEEARKQRAFAAAQSAVAAAGTGPAPTSLSSGKRYADLASKAQPAMPATTASGAWTTVGAGGKTKGSAPPGIPTGPAAGVRAVSGNVGTMTQPVTAGAKPKVAQRSTTLSNPAVSNAAVSSRSGKDDALEEFKRWASGELRAHLSRGFNVNDFLPMLLELGTSDTDLITEVVHSASQTIDSRHFAEEFVRRRKLADKGVVDPSSAFTSSRSGPAPSSSATNGNASGWTTVPLSAAAAAAASQAAGGFQGAGGANGSAFGGGVGGGWNDVAKKGPASAVKDEAPANFRVVPGKKKGAARR